MLWFEWSSGFVVSVSLMMASAQVVKTSVNTNNSPSRDYTTNPDNHSNHNILNYIKVKVLSTSGSVPSIGYKP